MDGPEQDTDLLGVPDLSVVSSRLEKLLTTCERHANSRFFGDVKEYLLSYKNSVEAGRVPVTIKQFVSDRSISASSLYKYLGQLLSEAELDRYGVFVNDYANQARRTTMTRHHSNKMMPLGKNKNGSGSMGTGDGGAVANDEVLEPLPVEEMERRQKESVRVLAVQYANDYMAAIKAGKVPETQRSFVQRYKLTSGAFRYELTKYLKDNNLELRKCGDADLRSEPGRSDSIGLAYIDSYRKSIEAGLVPISLEEFAEKHKVSRQWVLFCVRETLHQRFSDSGGRGKSSFALKDRRAPSWRSLITIYLNSSGQSSAYKDGEVPHDSNVSRLVPDPQGPSETTLPVVKSESIERDDSGPECVVLHQKFDDTLPVLHAPGQPTVSVLASAEGDIEKIRVKSWGLLFWGFQGEEAELKKIKENITRQCRDLLKIDGTEEMANYLDSLTEVVIPLYGVERGQSLYSKMHLKQYTVLGFYGGELINPNIKARSKKLRDGALEYSYDFATNNKNRIVRGYGYDTSNSNRLSLVNASDWTVNFEYRKNLADKSLCGERRNEIKKNYDTDVRNSLYDANVITINFGKNLTAFVTARHILPGEELFIPYGPKYPYYVPPKKVRPNEVKLEPVE